MRHSFHFVFFCFAVFLLFLIPARQARALADMGGGWYCQEAYVMDQFQGYVNCQYIGDTGGGYGGDPYGDPYGGGGGGGARVCRNLLASKPSDCENEIPIPSSAEYGYGTSGTSEYAGGSGLPKLIYWKNNGSVATGIKPKLDNLLKTHTQQLASGFASRSTVDKTLTDGLQNICLEQTALSPYPYSAGTNSCLTALNRLVQEQYNSTWLSGLSQWVDANNSNFGLSTNSVSFDFQTLISALDPANSLAKKYELVQKDTQCAIWWQDAREAGCV